MENENPDSQLQSTELDKAKNEERKQVIVTQEMMDKASKALATMLDYLGLEATVKAESRNIKINILVASDDAGRIIGRKGQSLESLQLLLNRMMQKADPDFPKVYIDIDGYSSKRPEKSSRSDRSERGGGRRERRHSRHNDEGYDRGDRDDRGERRHSRHHDEDSEGDFGGEKDDMLRQQAIDAAKEARRWGESVTLPQMNAHDRRIIHITLEGESDIQTESNGEGNLKSVIVSLKKG